MYTESAATTKTLRAKFQRAVRSVFVLAVTAGLAIGLAGCNGSGFHMRDESATILPVRLLWRPDTGDWQPGETAKRESKKNVPGIEAMYQKAYGDETKNFSQYFANIEHMQVTYNNVTRYSDGASGLELESFGGPGYVHARLRQTFTNRSDLSLTSSVCCLAGGVGLRWNFSGQIAGEGRLAAVAGGDGYFTNTELAVRYRPYRNFALRGGYAWLNYGTTRGTDIDVRLNGLFLGLNFFF